MNNDAYLDRYPLPPSQFLKNFGLAIVVALIGVPIVGATAPLQTTDANGVFARHIEAVGGREAILKHASYYLRGTFELPGQNVIGSLEVFGKDPRKFWLKIEIPNSGKYLRVTDGRMMWQFNPQPGYKEGKDWEFHTRQGLLRRNDEKQQRLTEVLDLNALLLEEAEVSKGTNTAKTDFQGQECISISLSRRNQPVTNFFAAKSGLRFAVSYGGTNGETFITSDYKSFDGLKIPTRVTRLEGQKTNDVFTISSVDFLQAPDSQFAVPIHMPNWPEDWHEIDEAYPPPSFAKNLPWPWKGEHSRWFTDGFGKANDDFFWSYVIFNALEGDTLKTKDELADALKRYDGSLYGEAFPPEKIKITIGAEQSTQKLGHTVLRRSVTVNGFDAEVSKKELTTHLEVFRWYCPTANRTGMLILRSPRSFNEEDKVWKVLLPLWEKITCHLTE